MLCAHCGATHEETEPRCARTGRSLDEPGPCGQTVDRYQIESLLQSGGFGSVYRGRHVHTRRRGEDPRPNSPPDRPAPAS